MCNSSEIDFVKLNQDLDSLKEDIEQSPDTKEKSKPKIKEAEIIKTRIDRLTETNEKIKSRLLENEENKEKVLDDYLIDKADNQSPSIKNESLKLSPDDFNKSQKIGIDDVKLIYKQMSDEQLLGLNPETLDVEKAKNIGHK